MGAAATLPRMRRTEAERFWDDRARKNALYFVDNEIDYEQPDEAWFWARGEEVVDRMVGMTGLTIGSHESVVDIGCGVGRLTRALASRADRVYAIDISGEMLARAQVHNSDLENVKWLHGDGRSLSPIADSSVDGCFSQVVFQHIPDAEITLGYVREMGRVLRPGGWALFQLSTDPSIHRAPVDLRVRGRRLVRRLAGRPSDAAWWGSAVDPEGLRAAAVQAGLSIERMLDPGTQYTTILARRGS
jgi:SAM-dependent methyltransferase